MTRDGNKWGRKEVNHKWLIGNFDRDTIPDSYTVTRLVCFREEINEKNTNPSLSLLFTHLFVWSVAVYLPFRYFPYRPTTRRLCPSRTRPSIKDSTLDLGPLPPWYSSYDIRYLHLVEDTVGSRRRGPPSSGNYVTLRRREVPGYELTSGKTGFVGPT